MGKRFEHRTQDRKIFTIEDMLAVWNEALKFKETKKSFPDVVEEIINNWFQPQNEEEDE